MNEVPGPQPVGPQPLDPQHVGPQPLDPQHVADWYPDPTQRFEFRYHNGQAWTGDVSVDGHRFLDPLRAVGPMQISSGVPERIGKSLAVFVLGVCSVLVGWVPFLCVLAAAGAIVALVLGIGVLRSDGRKRNEGGQNHRGHGYALAGVIMAPFGLALAGVGVWLSVVALRAVSDFTNVGAYTTEDVSCRVADGTATYTGTITNESGKTRSYEITIEFLRPGTSAILFLDAVAVNGVDGGETRRYSVDHAISQNDVDCTVRDVTGPIPFGQS